MPDGKEIRPVRQLPTAPGRPRVGPKPLPGAARWGQAPPAATMGARRTAKSAALPTACQTKARAAIALGASSRSKSGAAKAHAWGEGGLNTAHPATPDTAHRNTDMHTCDMRKDSCPVE